MRYLFILGRNPELSRAEVFSYLDKLRTGYEVISKHDNLLLVEAQINPGKAINSLGGVIAIGKVFASGSEEEIVKWIEKNPIYFGEDNKFSFSFLNFSGTESVLEAVKQNFKKEKLKANFRNIEISPENMRRIFNYFSFDNNFGVIEGVYDTSEAEIRDMKRPVRRNRLAISPRLAKILINLAQVKEQEILLDPFCGIGVILQEALLQNINVIGVDVNRTAIENCKRNLKWLGEKYQIKADYKLINKDSGRAHLRRVDGVACEPNLGRILEKAPRKEEAIEMQRKFESMMSFILVNLKHDLKIEGRIAFTAPLIKVGMQKIGCRIDNILGKTGLRLAEIRDTQFPLVEEREGKIVNREIYVLENS